MALNCNFMRLLTRDEPAVFFCTYLRSTDFLLRLCALTKQLRPALYLPVAATTSGGQLQPFAVPADIYTLRASGLTTPKPGSYFLIVCHLRAWFFALDAAIVCYAKYMFLYEYICPQQIRVYLIQSFPVQS